MAGVGSVRPRGTVVSALFPLHRALPSRTDPARRRPVRLLRAFPAARRAADAVRARGAGGCLVRAAGDAHHPHWAGEKTVLAGQLPPAGAAALGPRERPAAAS